MRSLSDYHSTGTLYLDNRGLRELPKEMLKYRKAKRVSLNGNRLTDISLLEQFDQLECLWLRHNNIRDTNQFRGLKKLTLLDLDNNNIDDLTPLLSLENLIVLSICGNNISELPTEILNCKLPIKLDGSSSLYSGLYLQNNPITYPPIEIVQKGMPHIKDYLNSIQQSSRPLNEVKVILIGDGASGKTSLLKRLLNQSFDLKEPQTHGIRIERTDISDPSAGKIKINFWDFGGQEIMHSTHQFFLSNRCIYLVLLDSRKDESAEYWLKHISTFGGNSPVLMVLNKIDENPSFDINRKFLSNKYPNIKGYFKVSCATAEGIDILKEEIARIIVDSEMSKTPFSPEWFAVKEAIGELKSDYISYEDFIKICVSHSVISKSQQRSLVSFLNDLGLLLHFESLRYYDTHVMNPLWLTNGVYRIINSPKVAKNYGVVRDSDVEDIVNDNIRYNSDMYYYPPGKCLYLLKIMQMFELCYQLDNHTYIIPDLLSVMEHDRPFDIDNCLTFVLYYENFLPNSVFPRLMVQLHHLIDGDKMWRTGMILKEAGLFDSEAYIYLDKEARKIVIEVDGKKQREFLTFLRKTIQDINGSYSQIGCRELIFVSNAMERTSIEYSELLRFEEGNQKKYYSGLLKTEFVVKDLLDKYEPNNFRSGSNPEPVIVFISYAHNDEKYKDELKKALSPLWRLNTIKIWDDRAINVGAEWEQEIFYNLSRADIIVLLISPDFISSEFCYAKELQFVLDESQSQDFYKSKRAIFPIRLRSVNYSGLRISKIQGVPEKWLVTDYDFDQRDRAWTEIAKKMEVLAHDIRLKKSG